MTAIGVVFIVGGLISFITGIILNNNPISVGMDYLVGGNGRPGTTWNVAGIIAVVLGIVLLVVVTEKSNSKQKQGEATMISGIIAIIALGVLLTIGGSVLIFIGMQIDNAFRHAWDFFASYWSLESSGVNSSSTWLIIGAVVALVGVVFIVIGIVEAVKKKNPRSGINHCSSCTPAADLDTPNNEQ